MADVTYCVGLPFVMSDDGPASREGMECKCCDHARLTAGAGKIFASFFGVRPSREFYAGISRTVRNDEWIRPKCDVKLIKLLRGRAGLPHRI